MLAPVFALESSGPCHDCDMIASLWGKGSKRFTAIENREDVTQRAMARVKMRGL